MIMDLENKVKHYICRHHLLDKDGRYLVALSGGADSVALLSLLHELGYQIEACHCNFHLRGEESNRDEAFCVTLCQELNIHLHRIHFDTKEYAALHKESIEMAARNLRYRYFEQLKLDLDADGICVAHHKDDSVETVLINLIRGTGLKGLRGILPVNGNIIRPLLCVGRNDILHYLQDRQQTYVTDSSNLVDDVVRNKIRLHVLPMLKEINPAVTDNISNTTAYLQEADKMLDAFMENALQVNHDGNKTFIKKADLLDSKSPEYALFYSLSPFGFSGNAIQEILASMDVPGKLWQSPTHQLVIDREFIIVRPMQTMENKDLKIPMTGTYRWTEETKIVVKTYPKEEGFSPSREKKRVTLSAENVTFPLRIRHVRQGDRFHPFGMKGSKLVSDYLTDRKLNLFEKEEKMVVEDAKGNIIWLVGERTSDICKITQNTQMILEIKYDNGK